MRLSCLLMLLCSMVVNGKVYISNLNDLCFQCLCYINGCERTRGCSEGYCGPFYLPKIYWADAGKPTLPGEDPSTQEAFENCTQDYDCAIRTIHNYLVKYGKDCNKDGVTNCFDFMMINFNGGPNCSPSLNLTEDGRDLLTQFKDCRF